ncbi:hypothetical protein BJ973_008314 [Actinoplanes tereljensis]|uniref:PPE family protein n=1 Tax=Paractinoplanes tereljensis TaxID=571912 RepID=A0A919TQV7_9ACTN|nr:hypothetical protein [Actinoplanes tereljensis]GIF18726.1 hypothetical protein Ate02nite_14560 [Actinoplanes tereljensis]
MAGTTNWDSYNLPAIWAMLAPDNVCTGSDRVNAWDSLATAVSEQRKRLLSAGQELAGAWPPEQNASAKIFLTQIDTLLDSMQETMTSAENTHAGLRGVMAAISTAQADVRGWAADREAVSGDLMPRFIDHAEDEYDVKAQQAMREMEAAIADHSKQIQAPALYQMKGAEDDPGAVVLDPSGGSSVGGSGSGAIVRAAPVPVTVPHDPVLPDPVVAGPGAGGPEAGSGSDPSLGVGPGLSGVFAPQATPALTGPTAALGLPTGSGLGGGGFPGVPTGLGLAPGSGLGAGGGLGLGVPGIGGGRTAPSARRAVSMRRGLPSGAVLGEGGLGGGRGAGTGGQMPLNGQPGRRGQRGENDESLIGGEADEQWGTAEGVAPVITPDTTKVRHDPGPGVLGFNR